MLETLAGPLPSQAGGWEGGKAQQIWYRGFTARELMEMEFVSPLWGKITWRYLEEVDLNSSSCPDSCREVFPIPTAELSHQLLVLEGAERGRGASVPLLGLENQG